MGKCREEFEAYMLKSGYTECTLSKSNHYDCYHDIQIDVMYSLWEASRESMKAIKLPPDFNTMCISTTAKNKIIRSITSAGYKVE